MIACYPDFYEDELVYSLLARYFERTGYINYVSAAKDLFEKVNVRPDVEFVNKYTEDAIDLLTRRVSFEKVIQKHTMFRYYCSFIDNTRRETAFKTLLNMDTAYHNYVPIPKHKGSMRYLRYCPKCVKEDRTKYGETYWHRSHQMTGVNICPIHFCMLKDSKVLISGKASPNLRTAEEEIAEYENIVFCENKIQQRIARYIYDVFNSDRELNTTVNEYLATQIPKRYYDRNMRNLKLLTNDINEYYEGMPHLEDWKIQKIFTGYNTKLNEVCMIAMFLGITSEELLNTKQVKPSKKRQTVRKYKSSPGVKKRDWDKVDAETLPKVKALINRTKIADKPIRITVGYVERNLGLPPKTIQKLAMCKAEVSKHTETQDEFWLRKISWAREVLEETNRPVNWKHIRELTNMRKSEFDRLCKM